MVDFTFELLLDFLYARKSELQIGNRTKKLYFLLMNYLVKKDIRFRKKQNLSESKNFCLKVFSLQSFSLAMHSHESKSRIVRRCILTERGRSITRAVGNLSRTALKDYFSMGFIPGYRKAVW